MNSNSFTRVQVRVRSPDANSKQQQLANRYKQQTAGVLNLHAYTEHFHSAGA